VKQLCAAVLIFVPLLGTACASSPAAEPETMPAAQTAAPDPRVGEMQTQLTELLERIDVLNQRIAQLEENQVAPAPVQTAAPVSTAEAVRPSARPVEAAAAQPQRALVGAQLAENYRQAIILFGGGKHADARRGFQSVFDADPSGDLADNALFWIGETYFAAKDYTNAVRYYQRVVSDYPTQNKAPDALFKIALAQERTGDLALARRTLQQVIDRFPYSSPASTAKAELDRIKF
jgi:tol-pal system protein YbgF